MSEIVTIVALDLKSAKVCSPRQSFKSINRLLLGPSAPEAESSFGALGTEAAEVAEVSTGRDVIMGGTAPADAELLDDADTETAAAAAERSVQNCVSGPFPCLPAAGKHTRKTLRGTWQSTKYPEEKRSVYKCLMHACGRAGIMYEKYACW